MAIQPPESGDECCGAVVVSVSLCAMTGLGIAVTAPLATCLSIRVHAMETQTHSALTARCFGRCLLAMEPRGSTVPVDVK